MMCEEMTMKTEVKGDFLATVVLSAFKEYMESSEGKRSAFPQLDEKEMQRYQKAQIEDLLNEVRDAKKHPDGSAIEFLPGWISDESRPKSRKRKVIYDSYSDMYHLPDCAKVERLLLQGHARELEWTDMTKPADFNKACPICRRKLSLT